MNNLQYPYYAIKLWADSLIFLIIFSGMILLFLLANNQPLGIIATVILLTITGRHFRKTTKNLYRNLKKQPALELTDGYLFDHINNVKIHWHNIDKLGIITIRGNTYVNFILRDKTEYYKQLDGFLSKILFKLADPEEVSTKIEISLVKGRNEDIYNSIYKFRKAKKIYNF